MFPKHPTIELANSTQPEEATKQPKTAEELQEEAIGEAEHQEDQEETTPSLAADEIAQAQKTREARKKDNELVLDWLIKNGGIQTGDDFLGKFKKVLEEKNEQSSEEIDQTVELLNMLPRLFEQVDFKIDQLSKDETNYKKIAEKRIEIIKGICEPVLDGHITASDALALVAGIEIVSKNDPEKQNLFRDNGIKSGYEGVMFFDLTNHKIYIFDETLVDNYTGKDGNPLKLNIRHMITHEMSHNIVEASVKYNKTLLAKANEIIEKAGEIKDSQSIHIRNTLEGIVNAESDFDKYFADRIASNETFKAMPEEQQKQLELAEKKKFISDRKIQAAAEILTDYTALYLQSDGSLDDFVLTCLKLTNKGAMIQYLGSETSKGFKKINEEEDPSKKLALIEELKTKSPKFVEVAQTYQVFYNLLRKQLADSKGKFAELVSNESEEEDPFAEFSGSGFVDGPAGFAQQGGNEQGGIKNGGGESLWKEFGALMAAMAGEAPNVS